MKIQSFTGSLLQLVQTLNKIYSILFTNICQLFIHINNIQTSPIVKDTDITSSIRTLGMFVHCYNNKTNITILLWTLITLLLSLFSLIPTDPKIIENHIDMITIGKY